MIIPYKTLEPYYFDVHNHQTKLHIQYSINHFLAILMNLRWFYIFQEIFKHSDYYCLEMLKIMRIHRMTYSNIFLVKLFIKKRPVLFFTFVFITTVSIFSFAIRLCELSLAVAETQERDIDGTHGEGFESFMITLWMVIVTLTTVGYGDYYPKTMPGRFLGFILCICGIVEISMIVVVLFKLLVLNYSESQALYLFNKLEQKNELKTLATKSIIE